MLACIMAFSAVTCFAADGKQYYDYGTYVLLGDSVAGGHNDLVYVDSEYYSDVEFMYTHGYMNGLTDMEFGPDEAFTKAALAQALYNIAGTPEVDTGNVAFSDIDSSDPTFNAAAWATSNGVLSAKSGKFAPDSGITVFNFVLILVKLSYAGNFVGNKNNGFDIQYYQGFRFCKLQYNAHQSAGGTSACRLLRNIIE